MTAHNDPVDERAAWFDVHSPGLSRNSVLQAWVQTSPLSPACPNRVQQREVHGWSTALGQRDWVRAVFSATVCAIAVDEYLSNAEPSTWQQYAALVEELVSPLAHRSCSYRQVFARIRVAGIPRGLYNEKHKQFADRLPPAARHALVGAGILADRTVTNRYLRTGYQLDDAAGDDPCPEIAAPYRAVVHAYITKLRWLADLAADSADDDHALRWHAHADRLADRVGQPPREGHDKDHRETACAIVMAEATRDVARHWGDGALPPTRHAADGSLQPVEDELGLSNGAFLFDAPLAYEKAITTVANKLAKGHLALTDSHVVTAIYKASFKYASKDRQRRSRDSTTPLSLESLRESGMEPAAGPDGPQSSPAMQRCIERVRGYRSQAPDDATDSWEKTTLLAILRHGGPSAGLAEEIEARWREDIDAHGGAVVPYALSRTPDTAVAAIMMMLKIACGEPELWEDR